MNELELQIPTLQHKIAAENFKSEFLEMQEPVIYGSALFDQMEYEQWLTHNTNNRHKSTVNIGWVTATTFFAVRKRDLKIVGMIDIRHNLGNEFLAQYGGHIGFAVLPSERKKGYATEILKMGIEYAKSLNIEKMMLGCFSDNIPSIKTIMKCGGVLTEAKPCPDGLLANIANSEETLVNIYWIDLITPKGEKIDYRNKAINCVKNTILPEQRKQFEECNYCLDEQYKRYGNTERLFAKTIEVGHVYEIGYPVCVCQDVANGKANNVSHCECSRQSILYVLENLLPDKNISVEIIETVLGGAEKCRFKVTVD